MDVLASLLGLVRATLLQAGPGSRGDPEVACTSGEPCS